MNSTDTHFADSLTIVRGTSLAALKPAAVAKVVRRVVDHEAVVPKLDVAKFNSAV